MTSDHHLLLVICRLSLVIIFVYLQSDREFKTPRLKTQNSKLIINICYALLPYLKCKRSNP